MLKPDPIDDLNRDNTQSISAGRPATETGGIWPPLAQSSATLSQSLSPLDLNSAGFCKSPFGMMCTEINGAVDGNGLDSEDGMNASQLVCVETALRTEAFSCGSEDCKLFGWAAGEAVCA